eukprot:7349040-Karenia_brevis.AAC.1
MAQCCLREPKPSADARAMRCDEMPSPTHVARLAQRRRREPLPSASARAVPSYLLRVLHVGGALFGHPEQ